MENLPEKLQLDKNNIYYLDSKDVIKTPIVFEDGTYTYVPRSKFYLIDGSSHYIIKVDDPFTLFHDQRLIKMLDAFNSLRENLSDIDLPIGYYAENKRYKGQIIPYYENGLSVKKAVRIHIKELSQYYSRDDNPVRNELSLYMDILDLLWEMYDNGMAYIDVHEGNFVFYKNKVKVIDFEPNYVRFKRNNKNYCMIIEKYCHMVNGLSYFFGMNHMLIFPKNSFYETKKEIKTLYKKI